MRDWPAPTNGVERNYGYMFQWWGMAVAALAFGLYAARRAARKQQAPIAFQKRIEILEGCAQFA